MAIRCHSRLKCTDYSFLSDLYSYVVFNTWSVAHIMCTYYVVSLWLYYFDVAPIAS